MRRHFILLLMVLCFLVGCVSKRDKPVFVAKGDHVKDTNDVSLAIAINACLQDIGFPLYYGMPISSLATNLRHYTLAKHKAIREVAFGPLGGNTPPLDISGGPGTVFVIDVPNEAFESDHSFHVFIVMSQRTRLQDLVLEKPEDRDVKEEVFLQQFAFCTFYHVPKGLRIGEFLICSSNGITKVGLALPGVDNESGTTPEGKSLRIPFPW